MKLYIFWPRGLEMPTWTHGVFIVLTKPVYCLPALSVSQSETLTLLCGCTWPIRFHSYVLLLGILKRWQKVKPSGAVVFQQTALWHGIRCYCRDRASSQWDLKTAWSLLGDIMFLGGWMQDYLNWMGWDEGASCGRSLEVAPTFAFSLGSCVGAQRRCGSAQSWA